MVQQRLFRELGKAALKVLLKPGVIYDVHKDWLKPYVEDHLLGTGVSLFYHKGSSKSSGLGDISEEDPVEDIKRHRVRDGKVEFKVRWKGATNQEDAWEPIGTFIKELSPPFLQYVQENGLENCLLDLTPSE